MFFNSLKKSKLNYELIVDIAVLAFIVLFLLAYFSPKHLLLQTITTGGDTASHYPSAVYLKEVLLPQGKIMGWMQGNYAGFPLFYHYFPLPFLMMAILGCFIPMQIAFKIGTVLGTFLLPICVYFCFRALKYDFPAPIIASVFSLAFLFNTANSMWGGNIPSTLAGEFSFSMSLAIFILLFGTFYRGILENRWIILNAFLFALMILSHGYTAVFLLVVSLFFVFSRDFLRNIWYMFKVYALGTMFSAFWLLPFIANIPWVTPFHLTWYFSSFNEIFPLILIPFFVLSVVNLFIYWRDRRALFFTFAMFMAATLYFVGPRFGLVDIRFLTFLQFFLALFGAGCLVWLVKSFRFVQFVPIIMLFVMFLWVDVNSGYIKHWVEWNYSGFEQKKTWPELKSISDFLRKTDDGGRVVYENAAAYNAYGTMRVFESLGLFAGRDTLEGLYMQSSITSPFVFYIQSEISNDVSAPLWSYPVSAFNLESGIKHLKLFNVTQFIVTSQKVKKAVESFPELKFQERFGMCDIYRLGDSGSHYVVPARFEPVAYTGKDWKRDFYQWFKEPGKLDVPWVYTKDPENFKLIAGDISSLPKIPLSAPQYTIIEKKGSESIEFETSLIGYPHIIRISYHPNWKVEGADKIYLVSPSFMLVYPKQNKVKLVFAKSAFNYLGEVMTGIALLAVVFYRWRN